MAISLLGTFPPSAKNLPTLHCDGRTLLLVPSRSQEKRTRSCPETLLRVPPAEKSSCRELIPLDCNYVKVYTRSMAPRAKSWSGLEDAEGHKVTMMWPKPLWREIQHLALEENTSATALMIEAAQMLLASRKEGKRKSEKKK